MANEEDFNKKGGISDARLNTEHAFTKAPGPGRLISEIKKSAGVDGVLMSKMVTSRLNAFEYSLDDLTAGFHNPKTRVFESINPVFYVMDMVMSDDQVIPVLIPKSAFIQVH